jgi:hypothetical protein
MPVISGAITRALSSVLPKLFNDPLFRVNCSYVQVTGTSYDEATGRNVTQTRSFDLVCLLLADGMFLTSSEESSFPRREVVLFAYQSSFPEEFTLAGVLDDTILIGGEELSIIEADPILDVLFTFKLQR